MARRNSASTRGDETIESGSSCGRTRAISDTMSRQASRADRASSLRASALASASRCVTRVGTSCCTKEASASTSTTANTFMSAPVAAAPSIAGRGAACVARHAEARTRISKRRSPRERSLSVPDTALGMSSYPKDGSVSTHKACALARPNDTRAAAHSGSLANSASCSASHARIPRDKASHNQAASPSRPVLSLVHDHCSTCTPSFSLDAHRHEMIVTRFSHISTRH